MMFTDLTADLAEDYGGGRNLDDLMYDEWLSEQLEEFYADAADEWEYDL